MQKYQIEKVNHGIANRFPGRRIEIHKKLFRESYAPLLNEIIIHEKSHSDIGFTSRDAELDLRGFQNRGLYWKFILTTPSAWLQFSPIYKSKDNWYVDLMLIGFWICVLAGGVVIYLYSHGY